MAETSDFNVGLVCQLGPSENQTNDKYRSRHGSLQYLAFFATAEVAMAFPNKRYYIFKKLQILM